MYADLSPEDEDKRRQLKIEARRKVSLPVQGGDIEQLHKPEEKPQETGMFQKLSDYYDQTVQQLKQKTQPIREGLSEAGEVVKGFGQAAKALYVDIPSEIYKEYTKGKPKK